MKQHIGRLGRRGLAFGTVFGIGMLAGCAGSGPAETADLTTPDGVSEADAASEAASAADARFADYLNRLQQSAQTADTLSLEWAEEEPEDIIAARPEGVPGNPISVERGLDTEDDGGAMDVSADESPVVAVDEGVPGEVSDGLGAGTGEPAGPTLEEQIDDAVWALRALLRDSGEQDLSPLGAMLRVALLESVQPGVFSAAYGPVEEAAGSAGLTLEERAVLMSTIELASSLHDELEAGVVDLDRFADAVDRANGDLRSLRMLSIDDARLCLRVDNFGVYREVERHGGRYKFIAGRVHPVIVYCELDHFSRKPTDRDGVSGYVVNIRQALELYRIGTEENLDSESTLVWQMDAQPVVDFSRRSLRDFFIVQVIELPANLSVGSYRMKIIATDVATGDQVERGIEFDMVADANAFRGNGFAGPRGAENPDSDRYNPDR
jgi:hypothetical protein